MKVKVFLGKTLKVSDVLCCTVLLLVCTMQYCAAVTKRYCAAVTKGYCAVTVQNLESESESE